MLSSCEFSSIFSDSNGVFSAFSGTASVINSESVISLLLSSKDSLNASEFESSSLLSNGSSTSDSGVSVSFSIFKPSDSDSTVLSSVVTFSSSLIGDI